MNKQPNYSNWVPNKLVILLYVLTIIFGLLLVPSFKFNLVLFIIDLILFIVALGYAITMHYAHNSFSYTGGKLSDKILDYVLDFLPKDFNGTIVDIGCGSGQLSIKTKKRYKDAKVIGIDYWGKTFEYAKEMCEENAKIEGVNVEFRKGDANNLDFPDNSVDAIITNFVFHEVRNQKDKTKLVLEALRIVKPGGYFIIHDPICSKRIYGDLDKLIQEVKKAGIKEVNVVPHTEKLPFIPKLMSIVLTNMGLLYGRK